MYPFNYYLGLYRRNNFGQPTVWYAEPFDSNSIIVYHGIVGRTISKEVVYSDRNLRDEIKSRANAKRKIGYKRLDEIVDNVEYPVEEALYSFLCTYLPLNRTDENNSLLPMLAKVYDNKNNRLFDKCSYYIGQYKINGLRCFISAKRNIESIFSPISLVFRSREGTIWNSLYNLEEYFLFIFKQCGDLLDRMVEEHYILDGELYLPGHSVNEINHFVKDPTCKENKLLQYWCYDIAIDNYMQHNRTKYLLNTFNNNIKIFKNKEDHLNNKEQFVVLSNIEINNDAEAIIARNKFIDFGFEGLIMRNPSSEYQYGKRNLSMIKYKKSTDGKFTIIDIYPEGTTRKNVPLFLLKNDINDATFECHIGGNLKYQSNFLIESIKNSTIGKQMYVEYGERSGVNKVPFHIKSTYIL